MYARDASRRRWGLGWGDSESVQLGVFKALSGSPQVFRWRFAVGQLSGKGGANLGGNLKAILKKQAAAIQKKRAKRGSNKIGFIGALVANVVILALGVILGCGCSGKKGKKTKTQFTVVSQPYKAPSESKKI